MGSWTIGSKLLHLTWSSYFDDFLSITSKNLTKHTDLCISTLFHLLGWELSGDKLVPYSECCKVLGIELNLTKTPEGSLDVGNTESRVIELTDFMTQCLESGELSRPEGEKLRGRLQFASNQVFGRRLKNCLKELNVHVARGFKIVGPELAAALRVMIHVLRLNLPRPVRVSHIDWYHIYVDASFEPNSFSGVGGIILDAKGRCLKCFSSRVEPNVLAAIMTPDQKTPILELEALAIFVALKLFLEEVQGTKVVMFTDNQSAQHAIAKCKSVNPSLNCIIKGICSLEERWNMMTWIERVPSFSNPSDKLSREELEWHKEVQCTKINLMEAWQMCSIEDTPSLHVGEDARLCDAQTPRSKRVVRLNHANSLSCVFVLVTSVKVK